MRPASTTRMDALLQHRHDLASAAEDARYAAGMTILTMFCGGPWDADQRVVAADAALVAFDGRHPEVYGEYVRRAEAQIAHDEACI